MPGEEQLPNGSTAPPCLSAPLADSSWMSAPVASSSTAAGSSVTAPISTSSFFSQQPPDNDVVIPESGWDDDDDVEVRDSDGKRITPGWPRGNQIHPKGIFHLPNRLQGVPWPGFELGPLFDHLGDIPHALALDEEKLRLVLSGQVPERAAAPAAETPVSPPPPNGAAVENSAHQKTLPATYDELRLARPHPDAYYSIGSHEWIVVTSYPPGLMTTMRREELCWSKRPHCFGAQRRMIDPEVALRYGVDGTLGGPCLDRWPTTSLPPTPHADPKVKGFEPELMASAAGEPMPSSSYWDVYVCPPCTASFTVSAPGALPAVLDKQLIDAFTQSREPLPGANDSKLELALRGLVYLYRVVCETVLNGERRHLKTTAKGFTKSLGWSETVHRIFAVLGYDLQDENLVPPDISLTDDVTKQHRATLIRAWLELGVIVDVWYEKTSRKLPLPRYIGTSSAQPMFIKSFCGNPMNRITPSSSDERAINLLAMAFKQLGATPLDTDHDIRFAYERNKEWREGEGPMLFEAFCDIAQQRQSNYLLEEMQMERSKGVYSSKDLVNAYRRLGPVIPNDATMDVDEDPGMIMSDEEIVERYQVRLTEVSSPEDRQAVREAMDMIKQSRNSELLDGLLSSIEVNDEVPMTASRARELLSVEDNYPEDFVIAGFVTSLNDAPSREAELREALAFIAEQRDSARLREYLAPAAGAQSDQGWDVLREDLSQPVGLRNVGNTCFLNSLLQYLYAIVELREVVLNIDRYIEDSTDATRPPKRVGGRNVTKHEIERSIRFVRLLQQLFEQLSTSPAAAVTPDRELELLALESSPRSEDSPALKASGPSRQNSTASDATVVAPSDLTDSTSPSVLGKRRQQDDIDDAMDVDDMPPLEEIRPPLSPRKPNQPVVRPPRASSLPAGPTYPTSQPPRRFSQGGLATDDSEMVAREGADGVMEILPSSSVPSEPIIVEAPETAKSSSDAKTPPALPPRKISAKKDSGQLLFGKQNDISECLDAMLFKIDIAVDPDKLRAAGKGVDGSIVRSLFTGTIRQTLEAPSAAPSPAPTEAAPSESLDEFNYLLVDAAQEGCDVYDVLDQNFGEARVDWEGSTATRTYSARALPPILQIQLQRVQYDAVSKRTFKSNAFLSLPRVLHMDRYLVYDPSDQAMRDRHQRTQALLTELRQQREEIAALHQLSAQGKAQSLELPSMLQTSASFMSQLATEEPDMPDGGDTEVTPAFTSEMQELAADMAASQGRVIELRAELDRVWADLPISYEYELQSVFMHRGEANFGHYFVYQRTVGPNGAERWIRFNDEQVSDATESDVLGDTTGSTLNPYWLSYVRKGGDLFEVVKKSTRPEVTGPTSGTSS